MTEHRDMYKDVVEQMTVVYKQEVPDSPRELDEKTRQLRFALCFEEFQEMMEGLGISFQFSKENEYYSQDLHQQDLEKLLDGALDLIVVVLGTLAAAGIDPHEAWAEVHRTNMAKADGPVRSDGKRLKPPHWSPPNIRGCLKKQGWQDPNE